MILEKKNCKSFLLNSIPEGISYNCIYLKNIFLVEKKINKYIKVFFYVYEVRYRKICCFNYEKK